MYGSIILIIVIEILFSSFMDFILEQIKSFLGCDSNVAFLILILLNLTALFSPTFFLVRSIKGINKVLIEASERNGSERDRIYYGILQFSTLAFVFIIDLIIMLLVPGPFGYVYMISILPVIIGLLIIYFLYVRYKSKKGEDIFEEGFSKK